MTRAAIVERPIDVAAVAAEVAHPAAGAVSLFVGTVRNTNAGRAVTGIEYSAYPTMAERELRAIVAEAMARTPGVRLVVEHRVGPLAVGEVSVVVASAHAHRVQAIETTSFVIEELKRRVPVWKRELYVDGTREWVHASAAAAAGLAASGPAL